jgi:hypothetical protein
MGLQVLLPTVVAGRGTCATVAEGNGPREGAGPCGHQAIMSTSFARSHCLVRLVLVAVW